MTGPAQRGAIYRGLTGSQRPGKGRATKVARLIRESGVAGPHRRRCHRKKFAPRDGLSALPTGAQFGNFHLGPLEPA